jgi:alkanesulfonate monooxygenase SsuD/methylene tetrahydromethanopterin reductase-like flavin-dependent oxidoreductase (luciferase family)
MLEWITCTERGPFSSVVVTDRVVAPALEPLAVLALAAGATRRIRLMTRPCSEGRKGEIVNFP